MNMIRKAILALALSAGLAPAFAQVAPPVPALPDTERRTSYSISASTCACAVGFSLFGDSTDVGNWIEVFVNGVRMAQAGNWTLSSVTGTIGSIPLPITNAVLTFTAPQTGTIQIVGARRPRRTSQFNEGAGVPTRNINVVVSDITATLREMWDKNNDMTGRGLFSQPGNTVGTLPLPSACIGKYLGFDATGLIPTCTSGGPGSGNVVGPGSSVDGDFALFNGATGALLKSGGASTVIQNTTANKVWAGPTSGGAAAPGFRALVAADIPQAGTAPQGRATLTSGVAVTTTDVVAATTVFYTAGQAPISDGVNIISNVSAQLSVALDSNAGHTGYHQSGKNFDVFKINDSGTSRICTGPTWDSGAVAGSNVLRGTGAGSTDIQQLGNTGIWVNTNALAACRWGSASGNTTAVALNQAVYLSSFRTTADGQTEDSNVNRLLYNAYNAAERKLLKAYAGGNPDNYSLAVWAQAHANAANKVTVLQGLLGGYVTLNVNEIVLNSTTTFREVHAGIGLDATNANAADTVSSFGTVTSTGGGMPTATYKGSPGLGFHTFNGLEYGFGSETQGWYTTGGGSPALAGLQGSVWQ